MWISAILHGRLKDQSDHPPLPVDITRKESRDRAQSPSSIPVHQPIRDTPWRQFTINYSAVCCSLEHNKDTNKHRRGQHQNKGRLFQLSRIFHRKIGVSGNWNCHHSANVSRLLQNLIQDSKVALHFQSQKYSCWIHIHGTKTEVETLRSCEN